MTTQYAIRDERGILLAHIDNKMMSHITVEDGKWRPYKDTVCFEYTEDRSIDFSGFGIGFRMMLWAGTKIIPVD